MAPLPEDFSGRVLDIGTGTGIWCLDMGDKYKGADIKGVDLSPAQIMVPPNVTLEIDDVEADWSYVGKFDFLHIRNMACSIKDWPFLLQQCFDNLKPGGWIELADWDYTPFLPDSTPDTRDNDVVRWHTIMANITKDVARATAKPGPHLQSWVLKSGFTDVQQTVFKVPVGGWARDKKLKRLGQFYEALFAEELEGISLRTLTRRAGMSLEDAQTMISNSRQGMRETQFFHKF
jgi:SAM-dependent methyltransferase